MSVSDRQTIYICSLPVSHLSPPHIPFIMYMNVSTPPHIPFIIYMNVSTSCVPLPWLVASRSQVVPHDWPAPGCAPSRSCTALHNQRNPPPERHSLKKSSQESETPPAGYSEKTLYTSHIREYPPEAWTVGLSLQVLSSLFAFWVGGLCAYCCVCLCVAQWYLVGC